MCLTCGCGDDDVPGCAPSDADRARHHHDHDHEHGARPTPHEHGDAACSASGSLTKNDELAEHVRGWLAGAGSTAVNLMSSPGSGKTSLLERTIAELAGPATICVVEGDQETRRRRRPDHAAPGPAPYRSTPVPAATSTPPWSTAALRALDPEHGSLLFVENVGNLVCPALFDVGEHAKVVVISVTEGDDKPLKYPHMFAAADLVRGQQDRPAAVRRLRRRPARRAGRSLNPGVTVLPLSVRTGERVDDLVRLARRARRPASATPSRKEHAVEQLTVREVSERIDELPRRARPERASRRSWSGSRSSCSA